MGFRRGGGPLTLSPLGTHCILELYECPHDLINDERFIRKAIELASEQGMSTLLKLSSHKFEPQGVTAVGLLAESHLSIHTWPENGYAAVDAFTCGEEADPVRACKFLIRHLRAGRHVLKTLQRGTDVRERVSAFEVDSSREAKLCQVHG